MTPTMTVRLNDVTLVQDLDYRLTYTSNTKAGTGNYRRTPFFIVFIRDGIIGAFLQAHTV